MGKKGDLCDFERGTVVGARRAGLSISKTADLLGFSRTTVSEGRVSSSVSSQVKSSHLYLYSAFNNINCNKATAGFFVSQLQKRIPSGTPAMQTDLLLCVVYGLSTDKLTFHFCNF